MEQKLHSKRPGIRSFRDRILNAGSWTFAGFLISQILRFGGNLLLTRLLVPDMFGVMAVVTIILIGLGMFSDVGLSQNIIQSRNGEERRFLNTAWVVQIVRGFLLFCVALLFSYLLVIAKEQGWLTENTAYADPDLPLAIAIMSLTLLISGFLSTKMYVAQRKLQLKRIAALDIISQASGLTVMIFLAWMSPTIWSLIIGNIVASIVKVALSHVLFRGIMNRIEWDKDAFYEIFDFGKWIFVSSILGFLLAQGDRLLLANMISAKELGIYSIAFFLASAAELMLTKVGAAVLFPAFSEIVRDRHEELSRVYYKARRYIDVFIFTSSGFLFASGESLIKFLYDDRYSDAGWMLQVLSIYLVFTSYSLAEHCFLAQGRAKLLSILNIIQVVTLYASLPIMFYTYGIKGAVWAIALSPFFRFVAILFYMHRYRLIQFYKEFMMAPFFAVGIVTGLCFSMIIS